MNLKKLIEKRNALVDKLNEIVKKAEDETRAMNDDENKEFDQVTAEIRALDATIEKIRAAMSVNKSQEPEEPAVKKAEKNEERAFAAYIRGNLEECRAAGDMAKTDNGAVIPKTIAKKIIELVKDICPIYALATKFNVKGDLVFPKFDDSNGPTASYAEEFTALTSKSGTFSGITLKGYLVGALTKVSVSLINNTEFDLTAYVVNKIAEAVAEFLEKQLLVGTDGKMTGLASCTQNVTSAAATAITADGLIDLQMSVKQRFQSNCAWIMNTNTFKAIRKLKNSEGDYLMNRDLTNEFSWNLLGRPVYISDAMPDIAASAIPVFYGDYSGLYVKLAEDINVQVLKERYAEEHVVGVIAWTEIDSKIVEEQKIAKLTMKSA
ncbi:phage major capsid protein [Acidaminococcus intestini]|uniref:phage major capsid protein n=1 Tax=Acidaminococcus intestini TaxID=187327 RepID=UPI002658A5DE|nr:phage major capsid protein [uncultured Dialister sp.]